MKIIELTQYKTEFHVYIESFLNQLLDRRRTISKEFLEEILSNNNTSLFLAMDDEDAVKGMLTLACYSSPSGKKGWIEDVVVDSSHRGMGLGRKMMEHAIGFAKEKGVNILMLTSNPQRISANKLYRNMSFEQKETNVYQLVI